MRTIARSVGTALIAATVLTAPAIAKEAETTPPATVDAIVAAVDACRAARTHKRTDVGILGQRGFVRSPLNAAQAKRSQTPPKLFSRDGAMIMVPPDENGCTVMANLVASSDWMALNAKLNATLGLAPFETRMGEAAWRTTAHYVRLDAAGSREKPGVRVIVAPNDPARNPATATKAPEDK